MTTNPDALDESASNSQLIGPDGNTTLQFEYDLEPEDGGPVQFEVTKGYLLVGYRRTEGGIRVAGINDIRIAEVPEPGALGLLGGGLALMVIRRHRRS